MIKDIALQYLARGWNVMPVKPNSKEPANKWTDLQTRRLTSGDVSVIFNDETANIGIITGSISQLVVVDVDGEDGLRSLQDLSLSSPVIALTGKGRHLYFSHTGGKISNSVRKIAPGIDIRGDGGYVLAAPSVHPETGARYRFITDFRLPLPVFPVSLLATTTAIAPVTASQGRLGEALSSLTPGTRHAKFLSAIGTLHTAGLSAEDIYKMLEPHAEAAEFELSELRNLVTRTRNWDRPSIVVPTTEESEPMDKFLEGDEKVTWIVPSMIAKKSIGFCVGLPEAQKTWIMMDLAIQAALGGNWCGLFPVKRTKTLFIEQERFSGETRRRFRSLLAGTTCGDYLHIKCGSSIKINLEHSFNAFSKLLDKLRPELVIIDSLATIHTKEENNRTEIQSVMEKFKQLRDQYGCAFLFVSHSNKFAFQAAKDGAEPDISLMAGSIALPAVAETVFMVQKAVGGGSTVHHIKSTMSQKTSSFGVVVEDLPAGLIVVRGVKA